MKIKTLISDLFSFLLAHKGAPATQSKKRLKKVYQAKCREPSDIWEHLPRLQKLAKESATVTEIGIRGMVSSWAILQGLEENPSSSRSYIGIDIALPPQDSLNLALELAEASGISFQFWHASDMTIDILPTELLFIDSLHTYAHLTYELEKFSSKVNKYIALHDTSGPWGEHDDSEYNGNYSEYPAYIDRTKRGLWPAVEDFLARHPEWILSERYFNNNGFTILKRISD